MLTPASPGVTRRFCDTAILAESSQTRWLAQTEGGEAERDFDKYFSEIGTERGVSCFDDDGLTLSISALWLGIIMNYGLARNVDDPDTVVVNFPNPSAIGWRTLHSYWSSKHDGARPPSRRDIDPPIDLPRLVANLMLLDIDGGDFRYRLVGSMIDPLSSRAMTGRKVGENDWASERLAAQWRAALELVTTQQQPSLYLASLPKGVDVRGFALILPLVDRANRTEKLLVGLFWEGYIPAGTSFVELLPMTIS